MLFWYDAYVFKSQETGNKQLNFLSKSLMWIGWGKYFIGYISACLEVVKGRVVQPRKKETAVLYNRVLRVLRKYRGASFIIG